jgi:hypothetical protein
MRPRPYLYKPTLSHTFVGLAAAKNNSIASLRPKSSISIFEFNAKEYLRLQLILLGLIGLVKIQA